MPGTHDELAVEPALGPRAAPVIADIGDRVQSAIVVEDRDAVPLDLERERGPRHELGLGAEAVQGGHGES